MDNMVRIMKRPDYINRYLFDWDLLNVVLAGKSAFDSRSFVAPLTNIKQVHSFLEAYGFNQSDPVLRAETFGTYQESLQFVRRYFLKEGNNENGIDLVIPKSLCTIRDVSELFHMATWADRNFSYQECLWAQIILKVMHTILHVDKDLRYNYLSQIQQQTFDRFYKYLSRSEDKKLYLGKESDKDKVLLEDFKTKSKKGRDSIIIKLLHKEENVTEEVFDRIGVRFVTFSKLDCLRVIKFLYQNNVIVVHNIKPSRSRNSLIDLQSFKRHHYSVLRMALRNDINEERFHKALNREIKAPLTKSDDNIHSSEFYSSIQFTGHHLIKYRNPFADEFLKLRNQAKETIKEGKNPLAEQIVSMDHSLISQNIRFFYPFEVQIIDRETHKNNIEGEGNHQDYKKGQLRSAMRRLFSSLIEYKDLRI